MMRRAFLTVSIFLAGCGGAAAPDPRSFDLGPNAPGPVLPPVRIGLVRAVAPFDALDMHYRLAYRNAAEIAAFAISRWAAAPADMLRKQLLRAAGEGSAKCALGIEIQEFTQVFLSKAESEARIEVRVALTQGAVMRSKQFSLAEANAGPDAESGTAAFARAVNRAIGDIGAWVAAQPDCR